jgi:hypothetical protein
MNCARELNIRLAALWTEINLCVTGRTDGRKQSIVELHEDWFH